MPGPRHSNGRGRLCDRVRPRPDRRRAFIHFGFGCFGLGVLLAPAAPLGIAQLI